MAARIAELCRSTGMTVFYDDFEKASLWGKDLAGPDKISLCTLGHLESGDPAQLGQLMGDLARPGERRETAMGKAKHIVIGGMWALAVAVGVGMAVANTPAVALAAPGDAGTGSSSGGSSPSSSSPDSGSSSSDTP